MLQAGAVDQVDKLVKQIRRNCWEDGLDKLDGLVDWLDLMNGRSVQIGDSWVD